MVSLSIPGEDALEGAIEISWGRLDGTRLGVGKGGFSPLGKGREVPFHRTNAKREEGNLHPTPHIPLTHEAQRGRETVSVCVSVCVCGRERLCLRETVWERVCEGLRGRACVRGSEGERVWESEGERVWEREGERRTWDMRHVRRIDKLHVQV